MIKKAGTILINKDTKKIGLVYRKKHNDISFPKGHLEEGETLLECAVRETLEETGRKCRILEDKAIYIDKYKNKEGIVYVYYYLAIDLGEETTNTEEEFVWIDISEVRKVLTVDSLISLWDEIYPKLVEVL